MVKRNFHYSPLGSAEVNNHVRLIHHALVLGDEWIRVCIYILFLCSTCSSEVLVSRVGYSVPSEGWLLQYRGVDIGEGVAQHPMCNNSLGRTQPILILPLWAELWERNTTGSFKSKFTTHLWHKYLIMMVSLVWERNATGSFKSKFTITLVYIPNSWSIKNSVRRTSLWFRYWGKDIRQNKIRP